jgi:hypothetical protein
MKNSVIWEETSMKAGGKQSSCFGIFFDPENGSDMFLQNIG